MKVKTETAYKLLFKLRGSKQAWEKCKRNLCSAAAPSRISKRE